MIRAGIALSVQDLYRIFVQLDEALLLDNERSAAALQAAVKDFRSAPFRAPSLAGEGYPDDPAELRTLFDGYLDEHGRLDSGRSYRGLVSPHIDYQRGGPVYAQVWSQAANAVRDAEVVLLLGTDHNGSDGQITLTRQDYATPYGVLPTDVAVVDALVDVLGPEAAFAEELNHRHEHSIELAIVWLHHMREGKPCLIVPILTGSYFHYVRGASQPAGDPIIAGVARVLESVLKERACVVVAAGDLAHIGPAFDGRPVDTLGRAELKAEDERLIDTICAGDAEAFFQRVQAEEDRRNVCGLPPIYLMLRILAGSQGELVGYDRCPADTINSSFVSICGVVLE
jgi:AmmeMemoRadiSam system protein B